MKQLKYFGFIALLITASLFTNTIYAQKMKTSNQQLSEKDKNIITISSFTAQGKLPELKSSLNSGLESGLTINEIKEILVHTYAYCGFPRSIRGYKLLWKFLMKERQKALMMSLEKEASTIEDNKSKYERGKEILGELTQTKQPDKLSGYSAFAPAIDIFLKEHLFADIFERDVLTYAQR